LVLYYFTLIGVPTYGQLVYRMPQPPPVEQEVELLAPEEDEPNPATIDSWRWTLWLPHSGQTTWSTAPALITNSSKSLLQSSQTNP
jgi:hypothetical protein